MDLKVTFAEKRWHGCVYFTAEPYLMSWDIIENSRRWEDMEDWCIAKFGPFGNVWDGTVARWYLNGGTFWFRNEQDMTLFALRWL